jgi:hypothetical protein
MGWTDHIAITAHVAFGLIDFNPPIMLINCLERTSFQAFPAGNTFFCDANAS